MPPVLGWAAIRGEVGADALTLCLIIFLWSPPHFSALSLFRVEDYRRAGIPMLPVTHGPELTRLHIFLYTLPLFSASLLPFVIGMSGAFYLAAAIILSIVFSHLSCCVGNARVSQLLTLERPGTGARTQANGVAALIAVEHAFCLPRSRVVSLA